MSAALKIPDLLKSEVVTPARKRSATELVADLDAPFMRFDGTPCARRFVCLTPDDVPALTKLRAMVEFMRCHADVRARFDKWMAGE